MTYTIENKSGTKVNRDAYFIITVTMTKVPFKIFCRGYDLSSWIKFQDSVNAKYTYEETTKEAYEEHCCQPLEESLECSGSTEKKSRKKNTESKKVELPFSSLENFFDGTKKGPAKNPGKNKIEKKRV